MSEEILEGVHVLDISCVVAAPMSATFLGEFGADVIKVEIPEGGDGIRDSRVRKNGVALYPKILNRNKKCITLDFHKETAAEIFYELVKWADVVVANFRPPTLKRFHIDYEDVVKYNPQIIYMGFSAYGRTGSNSEKPGYARAMESYAGLTYISGYPDNPPTLSGTWIADGIGGIYAAFMISLALYHRERTGEGQLIDLGLYEPLFRILDNVAIEYGALGVVRERNGNEHTVSTPNNLYQSADGAWIAMPVNSENMFQRFCEAIGREDLITDERTCNMMVRYENRGFVDGIVKDWFAAHKKDEIISILEQHRVAVSPVNSIADIYGDKHIWERGSLVKIYDKELDEEITVNGVCGRFSKTPGRIKWNGRPRGEDNEEIYRDLLHFSDEKIRKLEEEGCI